MEASDVLARHVPRFSLSGVDKHPLKLSLGLGKSRVSFRTKSGGGILRCGGFSDSGHVQYYGSGGICGGEMEKEKEKEKEKSTGLKTEKKTKKLVKRLTKDLSLLRSQGYSGEEIGGGLVGEVKGKMISEATEILLAELEKLKSELKEQKRRRKEEKAQQKAAMIKDKATRDADSSPSSSSESSDSDCGEVVDMNSLRINGDLKQSIGDETEQVIREEAASVQTISLAQEEHQGVVFGSIDSTGLENLREDCCVGTTNECSSSGSNGCNGVGSNGVAVGSSTRRIEVCMGGKCTKMGAVALLEEFERKVGVEGTVVGCKCMGKCKSAPNVKVSNCADGIQGLSMDDSVKSPSNPLFIGVGLEDVGVIVADLLGNRDENCLMATS